MWVVWCLECRHYDTIDTNAYDIRSIRALSPSSSRSSGARDELDDTSDQSELEDEAVVAMLERLSDRTRPGGVELEQGERAHAAGLRTPRAPLPPLAGLAAGRRFGTMSTW